MRAGCGSWPNLRPGLQAMQEIGCLLGMGGSLEDGPLIFLQDFEPVIEVGSVIVTRLRRDTQIAAQEGGTDFRFQLFAGVAFIAEPLAAKLAVQAAGVLRPVR